MFGGLAVMLNDKMGWHASLPTKTLIVRLGPAAYADALAHEHARPMAFTGKPMRGFCSRSQGSRSAYATASWRCKRQVVSATGCAECPVVAIGGGSRS